MNKITIKVMILKNIVFSGAGFKCWAYIGTLRALKECDVHGVEHVLASSAGALFGLFYILGIEWDFLLDFFMTSNLKDLMDIDIDNILIQQSLFAGIKIVQLVKEIMSTKIDPHVTFIELYRFTKKKFTINALNITDYKLEYFNYENTPDLKVMEAIRACISLPGILPPYSINEKIYYDGAICNNCPIDLVDEVSSIAFSLDYTPENNNSSVKLIDLLSCLCVMYNNTVCKKSYNVYNIIHDTFKNDIVNINQTKDDIFNIYMHGYINSKNILFKNHMSLPAP